MINVYENFLESYDELKEHALKADYPGVESPADGVTYPYICVDVPESVKTEVKERLDKILGREAKINYLFLRKSPEGVKAPQIAHHDLCMGAFTFILYLNDREDAGTALLRHRETGMCYAPESDTFVNVARGDQNNPEKWAIRHLVKMKENRAIAFDSGQFHCALPINGFGTETSDSRIALICSFS
ncbi:DUF6445 family protein [Gilvimarinus chinensis]|uniref:DUF6445 family protein n=1 Tax=Gilvimarinus chinensis TaxID=396005 RepID=UPI00035FEADC|nr:DUF6445 family protein [Gilvimarinus chinensis]